MTQPYPLTDLGVIQVSGADQRSYLQGQLTCDLTQLEQVKWLAGAHCDAKGKMWSNFILLQATESILLVMSKAVLPASLAALQKFGVFSKVTISDASEQYFVYGQLDSTTAIENSAGIAELPFGRLFASTQQLPAQDDRSAWTLAQISAGWPLLANSEQVSEFVPQMLNQADLGAISFKKGCYIGQETVARMQYLGKQKRATFYLTGQGEEAESLELEVNRNGNWRKAGAVINVATDASGELHLLAVLASDAESSEQYRLSQQPESTLSLQTLPYSIAQSAQK